MTNKNGVESQHLTKKNGINRSNLYYLSLGSNIGDKIAHLTRAINFLQKIGELREVSSLYETEPKEMESGTENFYNLVISIEIISSLSPRDILSKIKEIEQRMGRDIVHSHNLPRTIDIDILMVDDQLIDSAKLTVPHKKMAKRAFVLVPLYEIAPDLVHPVLKKSIKVILENFSFHEKKGKVKKIGSIFFSPGNMELTR